MTLQRHCHRVHVAVLPHVAACGCVRPLHAAARVYAAADRVLQHVARSPDQLPRDELEITNMALW